MIDKNLLSTFKNIPKPYKYAGLGVAVALVIYFLSGNKAGSTIEGIQLTSCQKM